MIYTLKQTTKFSVGVRKKNFLVYFLERQADAPPGIGYFPPHDLLSSVRLTEQVKCS